MTTTSTFRTSAPIQTIVVDALGSENRCILDNSGAPNFGEILSPGSSNQSTAAEYCDTYLRAQDASTKLKDYFIDINIRYRYVLIIKILNERTDIYNEKNMIIDIIKPLSAQLY